MKIGELAERAGCTVKAIRHYERIGLLVPPTRTPSGYRSYDQSAVNRLEFIRAAKSIGLTLDEIGRIVAISEQQGTCEHVLDMIARRLTEIDETVGRLLELRRSLQSVLDTGSEVDPAGCTPDAVCQVIPRNVAVGR